MWCKSERRRRSRKARNSRPTGHEGLMSFFNVCTNVYSVGKSNAKWSQGDLMNTKQCRSYHFWMRMYKCYRNQTGSHLPWEWKWAVCSRRLLVANPFVNGFFLNGMNAEINVSLLHNFPFSSFRLLWPAHLGAFPFDTFFIALGNAQKALNDVRSFPNLETIQMVRVFFYSNFSVKKQTFWLS